MQERTYEIKIKGQGKEKLHKYYMRYIYGVNISDLCRLLGPEAAARLLHFYGGTNMYLPSIKTVRGRLRSALVKRKCAELLQAGKTRKEVIDQLHRGGVGYSKNTLKMKIVRWFGESENSDIYKFKDMTNEVLLEMIEQNYDLFKRYRIV